MIQTGSAGSEGLSDVELDRIFSEEIAPTYLSTTHREEPGTLPEVLFVGGQPGSGKDHAQNRVQQRLGLCDKAVVVNTDRFRTYHPRYVTAEHSIEASAVTHRDATRWADKGIDYAAGEKLCAVVNGTMGDQHKAQARVQRFANYRITVVLLAVAEAWSRLRIVHRYLKGQEEDPATHARYVSAQVHDAAYEGLVHTAKRINSAHPGRVYVLTANHELYPSDDPAATIRHQRDLPWNAEEAQRFDEEDAEIQSKLQRASLPPQVEATLRNDLAEARAAAQRARA